MVSIQILLSNNFYSQKQNKNIFEVIGGFLQWYYKQLVKKYESFIL